MSEPLPKDFMTESVNRSLQETDGCEMNSQQMMEEIDRLTRLCKEKDAEIAILRNEANAANRLVRDDYIELKQLRNQLSESQAQIAMKDEAFSAVRDSGMSAHADSVQDMVHTALSATSETVAVWRAKETEPLRREVAMLIALITQPAVYSRIADLVGVKEAVSNPQAIALAYEREVKAKAQAPLQAQIDRLMLEYCPDEMATEQIENWANHQIPVDEKTQALIDRAANKGEVR